MEFYGMDTGMDLKEFWDSELDPSMVDPFRADAEMLQDCWFTSDSRDMKPSPVVLHDRLMTDAALGSLPIKNEHSYSIESDGDSGPSSPVTAVDDMDDECFATIPMQFGTSRCEDTIASSDSPVTVKEEPFSDDADSLDSSRANSPDNDEAPEAQHFVFDHNTATIQVTRGHNNSTIGNINISSGSTNQSRQQSLLRSTAVSSVSLSPNSRSAALFGAINPSSVHSRCQSTPLQVKLEAGVVVTHNATFGSPPTPPSSTSSDADSEGNLSPEHEILAPASTNTTNTTSRRPQHTGTRLYHQNHSTHTTRQPIHTPLISSQPKGSTGVLILTEEEKRTLLAEGYPIPTRLPLTKAEEKSLKKIRRKIKNKISAQESRRKKKEYMDQLERKVEVLVSENCDYRKRVEKLEDSNANLISQLAKLQAIVSRQHKK
uniref:Putative creb/atf family transcription factor n=1 Tax=Xenopsylla cheopis TaxID=163159 RepID=A0A6M2DG15_XENCH